MGHRQLFVEPSFPLNTYSFQCLFYSQKMNKSIFFNISIDQGSQHMLSLQDTTWAITCQFGDLLKTGVGSNWICKAQMLPQNCALSHLHCSKVSQEELLFVTGVPTFMWLVHNFKASLHLLLLFSPSLFLSLSIFPNQLQWKDVVIFQYFQNLSLKKREKKIL